MAFERRCKIKVRCLRTDGGGEYASKEAQDYLKEQGIRWERSSLHTPQQNGCAKRLNKTIMEMARCLMIDVGLGHEYWQYAAIISAFIRHCTPTTLNKGTVSPFKAMWGQKPNLYDLFLFGCKSQVHIHDTLTGKLNPKTKDCIFLGYAKGVKVGVFEGMAIVQQFVSRDTVVRSVRLNSERIVHPPGIKLEKYH
jgi:transposase InsO family protein